MEDQKQIFTKLKSFYRSRSSDILAHIAPICGIIDLTKDLAQKEEYDLSHNILQVTSNYTHYIEGPGNNFNGIETPLLVRNRLLRMQDYFNYLGFEYFLRMFSFFQYILNTVA